MVSHSCVPQKDDSEFVKGVAYTRFKAFPEMLVYAETNADVYTTSRLLSHFSRKFPRHVVALWNGEGIFLKTQRMDANVPCVFAGSLSELRKRLGEQIKERMETSWSEEFFQTYYDSQTILSRLNPSYAQSKMMKYNLERPEMGWVKRKLLQARFAGTRKLTDF
jgi:hypothetical protein